MQQMRNVSLLFAMILGSACSGDAGRTAGSASDAAQLSPDADAAHPVDAGLDASVEGDATTGADAGADAGMVEGDPTPYLTSAAANAHGLSTSHACIDCHSNDGTSVAMRDTAGRAIAPFDLWQGSMKANSARDPFFRAVVSAELYRHPDHAAAIEAKCLTCHSPMATVAGERAGTAIDFAAVTQDTPIGQLGTDGVSCVACHAMTDEGLGAESSFGGNFVLTTTDALYGPHAAPFARPMQMRSGYTPTQGSHIVTSEQCATCHTLFTDTIGPDGALTGERLPEQTPYLEWRNSRYATGADARSCQDCHIPTTDADGADISTYIARRPDGGEYPPTAPREPYGRHLFVGGNTLIPAILRDNRQLLRPLASDAAFDATIAAATAQLQTQTATVALEDVELTAGRAAFAVRIRNLTGHKFPTAYPSRRAWLHAMVRDPNGATIWESGAWSATGDIVSEGTEVQPHHAAITAADQVQIYESVLADGGGHATVALLQAARYLKDNRILPEGYSEAHTDHQHTAPVGVSGDGDFGAGGDVVRYDVALSGTPASVEVELVYQALGNRWVREVLTVPTPDVAQFARLWEAADRSPVVVARVTR